MRIAYFMLGLFACHGFAAPQASPGQWEVTTKTSVQGPQAMTMPTNTVKFCMKPEDAKDVSKQVMAGKTMASTECKKMETKLDGDTVKYSMHCDGHTPLDLNGEVTYKSNAYAGKSHIEMTGPRGKMTVDSEFSAKRLGDC